MNRTHRQTHLSQATLNQADARWTTAPATVHPALTTGPRWPALALALLVTAGVLAGADGLARHEARQAQALAASWAAETARVAQAQGKPPVALLVQTRRTRLA